MTTLLVHGIGELATLAGGVRHGREPMNDLAILRDAAVAIVDGVIEEVGPSERLLREWKSEAGVRVNAQGRAAVPGFVDPHTHAVFGGDRAHELEMKLRGLSYQEILRQGGGILYTVERTRESTRAELLKALYRHLDVMLDHGTTTVEVKTGYGLDLDTEARLMAVLEEAASGHPIDLVPTLMPAHAVPPGFKDAGAFAEHVAREIVPRLSDGAEFVDVFCEEGVFSVEESRLILEAGREAGLGLKVHAEELAQSGGARLAAEMGATSADHLLKATAKDREALLDGGVAPVLLPGTALVLGTAYADARAFIEEGHAVAIATDFNPNCHSESMPFAIQLACHGMRMTPAEALCAATINAAAALEREDVVGSIEEGKTGDLVILDAPTYTHIPYRLGVNPVWKVLKAGEVVVERGR